MILVTGVSGGLGGAILAGLRATGGLETAGAPCEPTGTVPAGTATVGHELS